MNWFGLMTAIAAGVFFGHVGKRCLGFAECYVRDAICRYLTEWTANREK